MIKKIKLNNVTWLDVLSPTQDEVDSLAAEYGIHPVAAQELVQSSGRSKVDLYDAFIYLILHFPAENFFLNCQANNRIKEIDFIMGKDFLITAHYEPIDPLEELVKIMDIPAPAIPSKDNHAGHLFYRVIRQLYQSFEPGLDHLNKRLEKTKKEIFAGREKQMIEVLSGLNHEILDIKLALRSHREILSSLEEAAREFYGVNYTYFIRSISGEYAKIIASLENSEDTFTELRSTNESMLMIKSNETMKLITAMAFVFLPVTLIATIFGMNVDTMPLTGRVNGFFGILGLMALTGIFMYLLVKLNKWI